MYRTDRVARRDDHRATVDRRWRPRRGALLAAVLLLAVLLANCTSDRDTGDGAAAGDEGARPAHREPAAEGSAPDAATVALSTRRVELPGEVGWAGQPVFATDGAHLVAGAQVEERREVITIGVDGTGYRCLTCGVAGMPQPRGDVGNVTMLSPFPDGRRLLVGNQMSTSDDSRADLVVLDCAGPLPICPAPTITPVALPPAPAVLTSLGLRMTPHLSPDGTLLAWHDLRTDGSAMVAATLEAHEGEYQAVDPVVLNPPASGDTVGAWEDRLRLYEVKSFAERGRSVIYVGFGRGGQADQWLLDLDTGERTRLTTNPAWDEDGARSPDGRFLVTYSFRGMERVAPLGRLPRPDLLGFPSALLVGNYYLSTVDAIRCMIQPWLLPADGDAERPTTAGSPQYGQPLAPYEGGSSNPAANIQGSPAWSPDGTRVAIDEVTAEGWSGPAFLSWVELDVEPTDPAPPAESRPGTWALPLDRHRGPFDAPVDVTLRGPEGGEVRLQLSGSLLAGEARTTYRAYADANGTLDGAEVVTWTTPSLTPGHLAADLTLTGNRSGALRADLTLGPSANGPVQQGSLRSEYDGVASTQLAPAGSCPGDLPRADDRWPPARTADGHTRGHSLGR